MEKMHNCWVKCRITEAWDAEVQAEAMRRAEEIFGGRDALMQEDEVPESVIVDGEERGPGEEPIEQEEGHLGFLDDHMNHIDLWQQQVAVMQRLEYIRQHQQMIAAQFMHWHHDQ